MPFYTPLRYPGGKRRLASAIMRLLEENHLPDVHYAEPYAGGGAVALALLLEEYASTIHINDLSRPVFAFWHTVLHDAKSLCQRVAACELTMDEWHKQRAVYESQETAPLNDLGFATLYLNRTNRSGIIGGGVIGGKSQGGDWKLDARFNKGELVHRIQRIARHKSRIHLSQLDALEFTSSVLPNLGPHSFTFFDPPYVEKGDTLYLNNYALDDHRCLAEQISQLDLPWIVTYDHAALDQGLFPKHRRIVYGLSYSAQDRYRGKEVMFLSDSVKVPPEWRSPGVFAMTPPRSEYPFYGMMQITA